MLDPLILKIIAFGMALLFLTASLHKYSNRQQFLGILKAYQILPKRLLAPTISFIPALEMLLAVGWLLAGLLTIQLSFVPLISSMLLTAYAAAMGINLIRGRRYIDCGCGLSSSTGNELSNRGTQQLSASLLVRNGLFVFASLIASAPSSSRALGLIDYFSLIAAIIVLVLMYAAFNQLTVNNNAIGSWRNLSRESSHA